MELVKSSEKQREMFGIFMAFLIMLCICGIVGGVTYYISWLCPPPPEMPTVSVESLTVTAAKIASDTQLKANMELVFYPMKNENKHNTMVYNNISIRAYHYKKQCSGKSFSPVYYDPEKVIIENITTAASLELPGGEAGRVVVRMDGVTVDVDEFEPHLYGRYGVSYLQFVLGGFLEVKGGKFSTHTGFIKADCENFRTVLPVSPLIQSQTLDLTQTFKECRVTGSWSLN